MTLDEKAKEIPSIMENFVDKMGTVSSYFVSVIILLLINFVGYVGYSTPSLYGLVGFSLATFQGILMFCVMLTLFFFVVSLTQREMFNANMNSVLKFCIKLKRKNRSLRRHFTMLILGSLITGVFTYATYVHMYFSYGYVVYPVFGVLSSALAWLYFYLTYKFLAKVYNSHSIYESLNIDFSVDPDDFESMDEYLKYCNKMTENN